MKIVSFNTSSYTNSVTRTIDDYYPNDLRVKEFKASSNLLSPIVYHFSGMIKHGPVHRNLFQRTLSLYRSPLDRRLPLEVTSILQQRDQESASDRLARYQFKLVATKMSWPFCITFNIVYYLSRRNSAFILTTNDNTELLPVGINISSGKLRVITANKFAIKFSTLLNCFPDILVIFLPFLRGNRLHCCLLHYALLRLVFFYETVSSRFQNRPKGEGF